MLRIRFRTWILVLLGPMVLINTTTTRGQVETKDGRAVAGADVLLADRTRVIAWTQTDANGKYNFLHWPINREDYQLLICAEGFAPIRDDDASSPLFRMQWTLQPLEGPPVHRTPGRRGRSLPAPKHCYR